MRKTILLIRSAALSTILIASIPVMAEGVIVTGASVPSVTVSATAFDLGSPARVGRLERRIKSAAAELCLTNAVEPVDVRMARIRCYRTAISSGHQQIERLKSAQSAQQIQTAAAPSLDSTRARLL